jgi:hypothetical protein
MSINILSLGWGVQSFTLACMSALGELPKVIVVHSDTTHERESTYRFAEKWTGFLVANGIEVVTVKSKSADIGDMKNNIHLPAHTTWANGQPSGMLRRQCTGRWKIEPLREYLRSHLQENGLKKGRGVVNMWLGISMDEALRMKDSDTQWINHVYPLIDLGMSRADCMAWLTRNGFEIPEKSACVFCPYHSKVEWLKLKERGGSDWHKAVEIDEKIRERRPKFLSYVHRSRSPLANLKSDSDFGVKQLDFLNSECDSGYCFA